MTKETKTTRECIDNAFYFYESMMRKVWKLQSNFHFTSDELESQEAQTIYFHNQSDLLASEARQDALNYRAALVEATSALSVFITNTGDDNDMAKLDDIDTIYLTSK